MTSNVAVFPGSCICLDHFGPLPMTNGFTHVLAITDVFSKYVILVPQKKIDSNETASAVFHHYVTTFGIPIRLHSDNGPCFASAVWKNLWNSLGTSVTFSTPYFPKSNGQIENFNKTLKNALIICAASNPKSWIHHSPAISMAHNATVSRTTNYTPNFLQLGREVQLPSNVLVQDEINLTEDVDSFVSHYTLRLQAAFSIARKNTAAAQKTAKLFYDRNTNAVNSFVVGEKVLLKNLSNQKLDFRYPDSCIILRKLHSHQYLIRRERDNLIRKANIAQLKPYTPLFYSSQTTTVSSTQTETLNPIMMDY